MASNSWPIIRLYKFVTSEIITSSFAFSCVSLNYQDQLILIEAHPSSKGVVNKLLATLNDPRIQVKYDDNTYEFKN